LVLNVFCDAALWSIWLLRNEICFQGQSWSSMGKVWGKVCANIR
jgi:hypothetical protein